MQQARIATDKVKIIIFYDMFKVQNTLAILTASAAMLIMACDGTATSEEILLPQEAEISSSSIDSTASSSSVDSATGNSSQGSGASSSSEAISSSSQEPSSSVESSSQAASSDSGAQITKMDKLPFDTTGLTPEILHYIYLLDEIKNDTSLGNNESYVNYYKTEYGDSLESLAFVTVGDGHYCHVGTGTAGGLGDFQNVYTTSGPADYIIMERNDSLLVSNLFYCTSLNWDACHDHGNEYAYTKKIMVGNDTFYYGEFEAIYLLVQVTDSTIINWEKRNPSYSYELPVRKKFEWDKSDFENDTMVAFISDDTIFIEKYNLKITDAEDTWIFGDEVCSTSTAHYTKDPGMTGEQACEAAEEYHNEAIKCRQRNLNIPYPRLFPSICRPNRSPKSNEIWCILDETLESRLTL